jgi:ABC-2 type transport system permease protein
MNTATRKIGALCAKDFKDVVKNPAMLIMVIMDIGFIVMFRYLTFNSILGDHPTQSTLTMINGLIMSMSLIFSVSIVACTLPLYGLAEEKEKHTLRTLMLANVSAGEILISKAAVGLAYTLVAQFICFFIIQAPMRMLGVYMLAGLLGAIPVVIVALVLGLVARDQMTAGVYATPVLLLSMAPMVGQLSDNLANVVKWLPSGGMNTLVQLANEDNMFSGEGALAFGICIGWIVVAIIAFSLLYKRLTRDN